jgi:hypothetical protein
LPETGAATANASRRDEATASWRETFRWLPFAIWAVFLSGLLLQLFSPHLRVVHNAFVIPPDLANRGTPVDPRALVQKERTIQMCSAFLALVGAAGLALWYRHTLLQSLLGKRKM